MKRLALLLIPASLIAGRARYARLGEFEGKVDVQLQAADAWIPAERNLPLTESAWLQTGPASRVEIELDEGSAWRLGTDSLGEISDYLRLSTGQRVTLLSLDHGMAYFTGEPRGKDALMAAVPGAQVTLLSGARVRLEAYDQWSRISVIEGTVRFSSPAAEMDLHEGQTARVEPANPTRFFLDRGVAAMDLDRWSEERDKAEAGPASAAHAIHRYGLADLDIGGEWIQTDDLGTVWKPQATEGWAPFQKGRWRWYDTLGYTWVSDEPWGWLPYHYGRWARKKGIGWVWAPSVSATFKPGEVYWLRGARLAGWGPLAPGEQWSPANVPQQYLVANTAFAAFPADTRVIDPSGFTDRPKEPLAAAQFAFALPSPAFPPSRLDATRPVLRSGSTRVVPVLPGVTFDSVPAAAPPPAPPPPIVDPPPPVPVPDTAPPPPDGVYGPAPPIGIVIVNQPPNPDYIPRVRRNQPSPSPVPSGSQTGKTQTGSSPGTPVPATPTPGTAAPPIARGQNGEDHHEHPAPPGNLPEDKPHERPAQLPRVEVPRVEHAPASPAPAKVDKGSEPAKAPTNSDDKSDKSAGGSKKTAAGKRPGDPEELAIFNQVLLHNTNPARQLQDLDAWAQKYPRSDFHDDRLFYYLRAYHGVNQPAKVLDTSAQLLTKDLNKSFGDPAPVLAVLYLTSANIQRLPNPTETQLATGKKAARKLLELTPSYFAPQNRPPETSETLWTKMRSEVELVARNALRR